jgi:N-methylhydantoinase B/oxoprolinase/acetone carboxylase alpha subunit
MGPANERDKAALQRDVRLKYVSREAAQSEYGAEIE